MTSIKSWLVKHKWLAVGGLLVIIVASYAVLSNSSRGNFLDERVVYIRGIDREGLTYYATVDDVRASLDTNRSGQTNTRDFSSIQKILLASDAKVELIGQPVGTSVATLKSLIINQPAYTGKVFTAVIKGGQIISLKEEDLEQ